MARKKVSIEEKKARSRERAKEYYQKVKQDPKAYAKLLAYNREYGKRNRDKMRQYAKNWRLRHPEKARATWIKSKYKLTDEQYQQILDHSGYCDSCETPLKTKSNVDHCHETGRYRGLLCRGCNIAAGFLDDDSSRALALSKYLDRVKTLT